MAYEEDRAVQEISVHHYQRCLHEFPTIIIQFIKKCGSRDRDFLAYVPYD
jgi:hypothetical protein